MTHHESALMTLWLTCLRAGKSKHEYDKDQMDHAVTLFIKRVGQFVPEAVTPLVIAEANIVAEDQGIDYPAQMELFE